MPSSPPALEQLTTALRSGPPLRFAMLFGSVAMSTDGPTSDIDIGIFPEDPALSLQDELSLQTNLSRSCGRVVDLVRLDRAPTLVKWQVVRHGRVLLDAVPFAAQRFIAESVADYLDFAPAFERAAERFRRILASERKGRDG